MTRPQRSPVRRQNTNEYASVEDFHSVFTEVRNDLHRLSFQLTGDHDKAEQCLVAGREECVKATRVFKEWARSWAKRTVIQNAIRELKPRPRVASSSSSTAPTSVGKSPTGRDRDFERDIVLALEDFERFVFVMSVLERYSEHECALLLGCTRRQIEQARIRAWVQLMDAPLGLFPAETYFEEAQELHRIT